VAGEKLFRGGELKALETFVDTAGPRSKSRGNRRQLRRGKNPLSSADRTRNRLTGPWNRLETMDWESPRPVPGRGEMPTAQLRCRQGEIRGLPGQGALPHARPDPLAETFYRTNEPEKAREAASAVLAVDAYDPRRISSTDLRAGRSPTADAIDGFGWASRSLDHRAAAYTQLAEIYLSDGTRPGPSTMPPQPRLQ